MFRRYFTLIVVMVAIAVCPLSRGAAVAWEIVTHEAISLEAAKASAADRLIRSSLGLENGIKTSLRDGSAEKSVELWVAEGSRREDDFTIFPFGRFLNHFHHPLRPWDQAGLSDILSGMSSAVWAQMRNQQATGTGSWSWQETRDRYYQALTSQSKVDRDRFLAQTFRGLGHQIHLIQDAASVPHARNEAHSSGFSIETWTAQRFQLTRASEFGQILGQTPRILPDPQLFSQVADPLVPVPVSKFIDADQYNGGNPDATTALFSGTTASGQPALLSPFGLSEYTNANFVHRDTIFTDTLPQSHKWWSPYPRLSSTNVLTEIVPEVLTAEDGIADQVVYVRKERDGEQIDHFLKTTFSAIRGSELLGNATPVSQIFQLDDRVYEDYAGLLLPRAVGYSAGLLDYFFRGRLKGVLQRVEGPLSAIDSPPYTVELKLTNESEEEMRGAFRLYVDDPEDKRTQLKEWTQQTLAAGAERTLSFSAPEGFGIVKQFFVVFQGRLGQEDGAVAGSVVGPAPFLEQWDPGLTASHPWAHTPTPGITIANPGHGTSTNQVVSGRLVKDNNRDAGDNVLDPRINDSILGPVLRHDGILIRDFQDALPVPITTRTVIKVKIDDITLNARACTTDVLCTWQIIQLNFSGGRWIQFTIPGQRFTAPRYDPQKGITIGVTLGVPMYFNISSQFALNGIAVDNLILENIFIEQGLWPYYDPCCPDRFALDPLPRKQRMVVDYIWISDLNSVNDTDGDGVSDVDEVLAGSDPLDPRNGSLPTKIVITSPTQGATITEGDTLTLSAANAATNGQIVSVEFIVNGVRRSLDTSAPFETQFLVPVGLRSLTIQVIATDNLGSITTATTTIAVQPAPPTVTITAPVAGSTFMEGQTISIRAVAQGNAAVRFTELLVNGTRIAATFAPFEPTALFTIPLGATQLMIGANAIDVNGSVGSAAFIRINVIPDPPPTVVITSPAEGTTVIEGTQLTLTAEATDNIQVSQIVWSLNGIAESPLSSSPYLDVVTVSTGVTSLTIQATASDNLGRTGTATRTIAVRPDPGTTVVGRIIDTIRRPFAGATVTAFGQFTAQSRADGTFSIPVVPTIRGRISVVAEAHAGTTTLQGKSLTFAPVSGGITDVGTIHLRPELYPGRKLLVVGNGPWAVAVADLDADGKLDFVTANSESDDVSVRLGNGDGTFKAEQHFPVGSFPTSVAVADLNADGFADIVTANTDSTDVSVLLGNGDGTFRAQIRFAVGDLPYSVAVADLNGDGFADIVAANNGSNDVSVLLGNGDGTFQAQQRFAAGYGPEQVTVADLNGDGFADLVMVDDSTDISILLGNGDGTFQAEHRFAAGDFPYSVAVADLNGDGFADIVTANGNSDDVSILLGSGDGSFQALRRSPAGWSPRFVGVADLNGDGIPDLVTTNAYSNDVSILLGNGDGTFHEIFHWVDDELQRFAAGSFPVSVAVADLNGDGFADIVTANNESDDVSVLLSNGDSTFQDNQPPPVFDAVGAPYSATVADLNRDGKPDIVTANQFPDGVAILLGNGDGTFQLPETAVAGSSPVSVAVADLNGDGFPDIVTANNGSNDVSVLLGNGDGTFQAAQFFAGGVDPVSVTVADLNGDRKPDLVTGNASDLFDGVSVLLHK